MPQGRSTRVGCEADMLQNQAINSRLITSRSEAEEVGRERQGKITGLEARARRREKEKVGLVTETLYRRISN